MTEDPNDAAGPLPHDWLPAPVAPADAAEWQVRLERILTAAGPALRGLREAAPETSWPDMLGSWWKPAAAMAAMAAAAAVLLFLFVPAQPQQPPGEGVPLSVIAAEGEPFALWDGLGIDADPVLALIALSEQAR
jgi:hypothetical protein